MQTDAKMLGEITAYIFNQFYGFSAFHKFKLRLIHESTARNNKGNLTHFNDGLTLKPPDDSSLVDK